MKLLKKSYRQDARPELPVSRPTVITLLSRIAGAAVTGGMLWIMCFAGAAVVFLHVNHFPADNLLVLLIFALLVIALFRGIRAWQDDLDDYRKSLTEYRMNMADIRNKKQVKKDIIWDRH